MHGAPSVGMQEIPPSLAPWMEEEQRRAEAEMDASGEPGSSSSAPVFEGVGMATAMVARPRMAPVSGGLQGSSSSGRGLGLDGTGMGSAASSMGGIGGAGGTPGGGASASSTSNKKPRRKGSGQATMQLSGTGTGVGSSSRPGKVILEGTLLPALPAGTAMTSRPRIDEGSQDDER